MLPAPRPDFSYAVTNDSTPAATTAQVGTLVVSSASANTFGTWTQIHAGFTYDVLLALVIIGGCETTGGVRSAVALNCVVNIGIGPSSGSVTTLAESLGGANATPFATYMLPIRIPANTPVWAQLSGQVGNMQVGVVISSQGGASHASMFPTCSKVVALGAGAASDGTAITPGNATEGGWTQIVASTSETYVGVMCSPLFNNDSSQTSLQLNVADIGIGASSSEISIAENASETFTWTSGEAKCSYTIPIWRHIPAGSRLSARVAGTTTPDANPSILLYGLRP